MKPRIKSQGDCPRFTDGAKRSRRIGTVPSLPKPRIGITADIIPPAPPLVKGGMGGFDIKLKMDYIRAVADAGGLPLILVPVPPYSDGGEKSQTSPLPSGERDRVRGDDVASIADNIDGLLLTGGDDIPPEYYGETLSVPPDILKPIEKVRIDFELNLFKEMMKRQKPILGICYGMQMVNVALGGSLYQDIEIQAKDALNHRQGQHEVKIIHQSPITNYQSPVLVNSSHHQAVKKLAHGLEVFAISEDGIIEGFYKPVPAGSKQGRDYPFLVCVQWHPERDIKRDGISLSLFKAFVKMSKKAK